jgi:hypothetical protein
MIRAPSIKNWSPDKPLSSDELEQFLSDFDVWWASGQPDEDLRDLGRLLTRLVDLEREKAGQPKPPRRPRQPRLSTLADQARKIGASAFTRDGVTWTIGNTRTAQDDDVGRELAAFEARHGQT